MVIRFRLSPAIKAFATSNGQMEGAIASAPVASRSRISSVPVVLSSGKHQASVTEASSTNRLVTASFIDQIPNSKAPQGSSLADLADFTNQLLQIFLASFIRWHEFGDRNSAARNPNRLALRHLIQEFVEVGCCLKRS